MKESVPNNKIEFPCDYLIKVIGEDNNTFTNDICEMVSSETKILNLTENRSQNKRFISLSITIDASNEAMIKTLFEKLNQHPAVKMIL